MQCFWYKEKKEGKPNQTIPSHLPKQHWQQLSSAGQIGLQLHCLQMWTTRITLF